MNKNALHLFFSEELYKGKITARRLESILKTIGFTVITFPKEDPGSVKLLSAYHLAEKARILDCFAYQLRDDKYIFIQKELSDRDRIPLFLHELGHICYDHLIKPDGAFDTNVFKELQAHTFCLTVLFLNRVIRFFRPIVICLFVALLFFVVPTDDPTFGRPVSSEPAQVTAQTDPQDPKEEIISSDPLMQEIVYWSPGGEVYHLDPNCQHLINAIEIQSGTPTDCNKKRCCYSCQKKN